MIYQSKYSIGRGYLFINTDVSTVSLKQEVSLFRLNLNTGVRRSTLRPLIAVPPYPLSPKFNKNYHPFPFINTPPPK